METLIKDQVTLDNWQIDQQKDHGNWKNIVNQAWQDLSHGTVWESKSDTTYPRSKLSEIIGSICENNDFIMKTHEGLVDKGGSKIQWKKNTFLKSEDPPPGKESNLSDQIKILTQTLKYKQ